MNLKRRDQDPYKMDQDPYKINPDPHKINLDLEVSKMKTDEKLVKLRYCMCYRTHQRYEHSHLLL